MMEKEGVEDLNVKFCHLYPVMELLTLCYDIFKKKKKKIDVSWKQV